MSMDLELQQLKDDTIGTQVTYVESDGEYDTELSLLTKYTVLDVELNIMSDEYDLLITNDLGETKWYHAPCFTDEEIQTYFYE